MSGMESCDLKVQVEITGEAGWRRAVPAGREEAQKCGGLWLIGCRKPFQCLMGSSCRYLLVTQKTD